MDVKAVRRFAATFVTDTTNPPAPRPRWLRRGRYDLVEVADVIIALICFAVTNSTLTNENASRHGQYASGLLVLLAFVDCAPLALRTRFPLGAWMFSAAALVGTSLIIPPGSIGGPDAPLAGALVYGLCLYAVTVRCRPGCPGRRGHRGGGRDGGCGGGVVPAAGAVGEPGRAGDAAPGR